MNRLKTDDEIYRIPEVADVFGINEDIGGFIASKIGELNAASAERLRKAAAVGYELRMGAFRVRNGVDPTPIHLPSYDTYNALSPASLPRISVNISEAEASENAKEVKATMELATKAKAGLNEIIADFRQRVDVLRQKLQQQQAALTNVSGNAAIVAQMRTLAQTLRQQNNQALTPVANDLSGLADSVDSVRTKIQTINQSITRTVAGFSNITQGATSPDAVLLNILGLANTGITNVTDGATEVLADLAKIRTGLDKIETDVNAFAQAQQTKDLAGLVRSQIVSVITEPLNQLKSLAESLTSVRGTVSDSAPLLTLDAPEIQTVSEIVPTRLEIPRTDPADGDLIDIAAIVYQNNRIVYEERRSVTVRFYGWHSGLTSGLIFARAEKAQQSNFKPEAAAVWRIGFTPRPGSKNLLGVLRPGIGFHVTTLHFNTNAGTATTATTNDSNNIQFGTGVTLHLFKDVIQTGYGWNLGVQKDRGYTYIGIGIIRVLRQLLAQRSMP